jgi:glycerophosphoryl diester phosphodiesterase
VGAFTLGLAQGADGVELDVHLTADRHVVVFHDGMLTRLAQPQRALSSLTLAEVRALDVRALVKDGPPEDHAVTIPTLTEVFDALPSHARVNVELKDGQALQEDGLEVEVLRVVARAQAEHRVIYSAFHPMRCARLRRLAPDAWVGMLHEPESAAFLRHLYLLPAVLPHAVHPHFSMVDEPYMTHARLLRLAVHVWTVNEPAEMLRLASLGVHAIITDCPDVAVATLRP